MESNSGKLWSDEENAYLTEVWGRVSIPSIAARLHRSVKAVRSRAIKYMKLDGFLKANEERIPMFQLLKILGVNPNVTYWCRKYPDMPFKSQIIAKRRVYTIRIDDFWRWLDKNRDAFSLAHLEPLALGGEPAWVKSKRLADYEAEKMKPRRWTKDEDNRLIAYVKKGMDLMEIARLLNRRIIATKRRIPVVTAYRLPPVKNRHRWSAEERRTMANMFIDGYTIEQVTEAMGLEREQVVAQMKQLYKTRNADRLREIVAERGIVTEYGKKNYGNREAKAG